MGRLPHLYVVDRVCDPYRAGLRVIMTEWPWLANGPGPSGMPVTTSNTTSSPSTYSRMHAALCRAGWFLRHMWLKRPARRPVLSDTRPVAARRRRRSADAVPSALRAPRQPNRDDELAQRAPQRLAPVR